jgi:hypothetical protein
MASTDKSGRTTSSSFNDNAQTGDIAHRVKASPLFRIQEPNRARAKWPSSPRLAAVRVDRARAHCQGKARGARNCTSAKAKRQPRSSLCHRPDRNLPAPSISPPYSPLNRSSDTCRRHRPARWSPRRAPRAPDRSPFAKRPPTEAHSTGAAQII